MTDEEKKLYKELVADYEEIDTGSEADKRATEPVPEDKLNAAIARMRKAGKESQAEFAREILAIGGELARAFLTGR